MSEGDIGANRAGAPAEPDNTPVAVPAPSAQTSQQKQAAVPARKQTAFVRGAVIGAGGMWVRRCVAGLFFLGMVAGILGTLLGVHAHSGVVLSVPAQTGSSLTPGNAGWTTPKPVGGASLPGVAPASLGLEIGPIDVAAETIPARVSLSFPEGLVSHLRWKIAGDRALVPLAAIPYQTWAQLPVGIWLTMCVDSSAGLGPCGTPTATISLGQLLGDGGRPAAVPAPVTLPVSGTPNRFPSDVYVLDSYPQLTLPSGIVLATPAAGGSVTTRSVVPAQVSLFADAVFGDRWVTASQYGQEIALWIRRPTAYQLTVFLMALLPLFLGVVVVDVSVRRGALRSKGPVFDLGLITGLIAAILAILPLRAVLVPSELDVAGLTLLDYILVLDVLFIAAFLFFQYARLAWRPPMPGQTDAQELPAKDDKTEPK